MDADLIRRSQSGDLKAFELLVKRYQHYVYTIVYRVVKRHEEAEEVCQDVFLKIHSKLNTFNFESKFSSWIYSIAIRTAIDQKRKLDRKKDNPDSLESHAEHFVATGATDGQLVIKNRQHYVEQAIGQLSQAEALIITMFYLEELNIQEICELLDLNKNNVKIKLFRARKNLRKILDHILQDEIKSIL